MLKVWNACLIVATFSLALLGTFLVRSGVLQSIHAFGDSTVGPYILGLIAVVADRLDGADRLPPRRPPHREADRLAGLARGGLPGQQPAAGRALRGDLLGHLLPADLRALHRREVLAGGAVVRPLHDPAGDPAGPVHRDRAAARLAPGQLGLGEAGLPLAGGRRRRRRGRLWRSSHRRRRAALGARPLRLRRLRPGRPRAGVLARRGGAADAGRRLDAGGARRGRRPATAAATAATSSTPASPCC